MEAKRFPVAIFILVLGLVFGPGAVAQAGAQAANSAGLFCDLFTLFGASSRPGIGPGYALTGEDISAFAERPAVLSAGFFLKRGWFEASMALDLHQDIGAWLMGGSWSNLPKAPDSWSLMWGNNYPQVGYAQASGDSWLVSAGRRRIGVGPGTYGLGTSSENPWYDHVLARVEAPVGSGTIGYSFTTFGAQRFGDIKKKNLFLHRAYWRSRYLSIAFGEFNLLVGDSIDLQDIGPFLVYHHLFNSNSNVMLELEIQARPAEALRLYGEFVLDDFQIPGEGSESNPNAMGFMGGLEWRILSGARSARPAFFRADHGLRLDAAPLELRTGDSSGGLRLKAETWLASTYLYRRSLASIAESWTGRYFFHSSTALGYQVVEPFFASPLGPDTWLNRLELSWNEGKVESLIAVEYRVQGAESERRDYSPPYSSYWLGPQEPVSRRLDFVLGVMYAPSDRIILTGKAALSFREAETRMSIDAGFGYRFGVGAIRRPR